MRSAISPLLDIKVLRQINKIVMREEPDLIHCHSSKAGLLGRISSKMTGIPVLFTIHGWSWLSVSGLKSKIALFVEKIFARVTESNYLYVCSAVERIGRENLSISDADGRVIYNGVEDSFLNSNHTHNGVRFIMPARVAYPKDHETLIKAFDACPDGNKLILCGHGTDDLAFKETAKLWAPNRFNEIEFMGARSDMKDQLNRSDVLVLSSRSEAMPLSILEGMSAGLPIIATNAGGIPEMVSDGETGIIVKPGDVCEMNMALMKMIDDDFRKVMGERGRLLYMEKFTSDKMAMETLFYYNDIIERKQK